VLDALDDAEGPRGAAGDVEPAVVHALEHLVDDARAAALLQAVVAQPHDPELGLVSSSGRSSSGSAPRRCAGGISSPGSATIREREEGEILLDAMR
jgi:hypothetical protein